jgi:4'-phosphopantetheinyl transferase
MDIVSPHSRHVDQNQISTASNLWGVDYFCQTISDTGITVYHCFSSQLQYRNLRFWIERLDPSAQARLHAFRAEEDKLSLLLGRMLLSVALEAYANPALLQELRYSSIGKPYLPGLEFSISHSADLVVLAISSQFTLGIDCEEITDIEIRDFQSYFSPAEWNYIHSATSAQKAFYRLWTRKEALLKALGTGLDADLPQLEVLSDSLYRQRTHWIFRDLSLGAQYCTHLCYSPAGTE